ncbi:hypothetical protein K402DRAFT_450119 [Aulographum hederae CBS 113979]|uniref:WD40 repeat-like protein n=1 Tax=Aulographum hederae CBS 113979 TaxID=1176131 RepID=A0A6G1HFK7_9PEZI|nr:hypothetical protein K402DRAFT_450119 [Aulographum hederae CBS 113979]
MKNTIHDRLLRRQLGDESPYSSIRGIYGDRRWIEELDIVNELNGHTGCVNALSWSRSGNLLASGSDDTHVNIHSYLPQNSTSQFQWTTTISTGHTQNIFSVKFLPHSNDRTIVTAAGDSTVRIFDIEYSGRSAGNQDIPRPQRDAFGRSRGITGIRDGVSYLSRENTNGKVFRSHSDRVKRIVTESSPYYFMTCSEDGEVRQWDIRQPESAYPKPGSVRDESKVPSPLITYKRYGIDLNTISCSPSQPHYIALGGNHLHCFLHDRRMLGRDKLRERGAMLSPGLKSRKDEERFGEATQCVRKFAPDGQPRMSRTDGGHITACKISDANPNEIIVSWSGDSIYSFDLIRSPDASSYGPVTKASSPNSNRVKESQDRKRKRLSKKPSVASLEASERAGSRPRTDSSQSPGEEISLMVQYGNGQSEEIHLDTPPPAPRTRPPPPDQEEDAPLTEMERISLRLAQSLVKLRQHMFSPGPGRNPTDEDPIGHVVPFSVVLGIAAPNLPEMSETIRSWRYPVDPDEGDVVFQNKLRADRASGWRFIQAAGTLARVLGGKIPIASGGTHPALYLFTEIGLAPSERYPLPQHEQFCYDFLKAILLWLDSGVGAILRGFAKPSSGLGRNSPRFPISEESSIDDVDDVLIPYLLNSASNKPIMDVDASRFEVDENQVAFTSEQAAVLAFARAVKTPFEDLSSAVVPANSTGGAHLPEKIGAQDRKAALQFWAFKVGRGLLMSAGKEVNFALVDKAFGGLGELDESTRGVEERERRRHGRIEEETEETMVENVTLRRRRREHDDTTADENEDVSDSEVPLETLQALAQEEIARRQEQGNDGSHDDEDDENDSDDEDEDMPDAGRGLPLIHVDTDDEEGTESDSDAYEGRPPRFLYRSSLDSSQRSRKYLAHASVPCAPPTRRYTGHCNVRTVKDVAFLGLNDEYVASGSDSGHLFIWDKKTSQLVNILEGDGEVVNVIQGHPYEPVVAVSGIDHSVKVFGYGGGRERKEAAAGRNGVKRGNADDWSSIEYGRMRRRPRQNTATGDNGEDRDTTAAAAVADNPNDDPEIDDEDAPFPVAPTGLESRRRMQDEYTITAQNEAQRVSGQRAEGELSSDLMQLIAIRLRQQMAAAAGNLDEFEGGEATAEGEEGCSVM